MSGFVNTAACFSTSFAGVAQQLFSVRSHKDKRTTAAADYRM
jgi:hypothetical protein